MYTARMSAQSSVNLTVQAGEDIGRAVNAAIATLPGGTGKIYLPAGSFLQSSPIKVTGNDIHLIGASSGTIFHYDPAKYHLVDSADSLEGWRALDATLSTLTSFGEDHPNPMEGSGYLSVATVGGYARITKTMPATNFTLYPKIGVWFATNLTSPPGPFEFFVSDGSRTAYWSLNAASIYATWKFVGLSGASPTGSEGGMPDMARITSIGFRKLSPQTKYYFDAVSLYAAAGPAVEFSSCRQCSLEGVDIEWEPAADADAGVLADGSTGQLLVRNVRVRGAADGISFIGPSANNVCERCSVDFASQNGISLRGSTSGDQILAPRANRNVVGIYVGEAATGNTVSGANCVENDGAGIFVDGNDNKIANVNVLGWMTFGLVILGAHNSVDGVTASSAVGESAVQLIGGAAENTLSNINILQSGGSGLDLGGGVKPQIHNTASDVTVHNSGSSSWHGGPKASSEGRGLCLCNAKDNTITHLRIYDTAQKSTVPGAEGIIVNNGSSGNILEDVLIVNARHEGITLWDASDNTFRDVRLVGNGMREGHGAGIRIAAGTKNTVLENICYWMNGGGGIQNLSRSSVIRNAKQVRQLKPESACQ